MDYRNWLVPIIGDAVEKAMKALGKGDQEIKAVRGEIEDSVLKDSEVNAKIDNLIREKLTLDTGPWPGLRALVRPVVTIILACTFVFLIVIPFVTDLNPYLVNWDKIFASFMGVFGTIIGFWFGERSALKVPGAEAKVIAKPTSTPTSAQTSTSSAAAKTGASTEASAGPEANAGTGTQE